MRMLLCFVLLCLGCGKKNVDADTKQSEATARAMAEAERQIGMPAITNFQERRLAKMIFELRDQSDLTTYAYIVSLEGKLIFIGKCIGFGLPYSVQYTNPMRSIHMNPGKPGENQWTTIPQADPNGPVHAGRVVGNVADDGRQGR